MAMRFQPVAAEGGSAIVKPFGSTLTLTGTPGSAAPFTAPVSDFPLSITMVPFFSTFPDHSMMPDDGMGIYLSLVPQVVLRAITDAGHIITEETPDEVNELLIALLRRAGV